MTENIVSNDLDTIQNFINDTFVDDDVSMTGANIIRILKKKLNFEASDEQFLDIFRAAVRCGRLTGIRSAKRAGYKTSQEDPKPHELADDIVTIQEFIDKAFIKRTVKMSSVKILEMLKGKLSSDIPKARFAVLLRELLLCGELTGIRVQGKGYVNLDVEVEESTKETEPLPLFNDADVSGCILRLTKTLRIAPLDKRNWSLQGLQPSKDGFIWSNKLFWPNLKLAIKGSTEYLINNKVRNCKIEINDLNSMYEMITKIEKDISKAITGAMELKEESEIAMGAEATAA